MSRTTVRMIRPHRDDTQFGDYHEMVLIGRRNGPNDYTEHEQRDAIGRKLRPGATGYRWHIAICNNPQCDAEMVVQLDKVVTFLAAEVGL